MPKFLVALHRPAARHGYPFNPFLKPLHPDGRIDMVIREWEMEARDSDEIMEFLQDAYDEDLPTVRGFTLRSIEEIKDE